MRSQKTRDNLFAALPHKHENIFVRSTIYTPVCSLALDHCMLLNLSVAVRVCTIKKQNRKSLILNQHECVKSKNQNVQANHSLLKTWLQLLTLPCEKYPTTPFNISIHLLAKSCTVTPLDGLELENYPVTQ